MRGIAIEIFVCNGQFNPTGVRILSQTISMILKISDFPYI